MSGVTFLTDFQLVKAARGMLGFRLERRKEIPPLTRFNLLGATQTIGGQWVAAALPGRRKLDLVYELRPVLSANRLSPGLSAKIRGGLGFAQSLLFGRIGAMPPGTVVSTGILPLSHSRLGSRRSTARNSELAPRRRSNSSPHPRLLYWPGTCFSVRRRIGKRAHWLRYRRPCDWFPGNGARSPSALCARAHGNT